MKIDLSLPELLAVLRLRHGEKSCWLWPAHRFHGMGYGKWYGKPGDTIGANVKLANVGKGKFLRPLMAHRAVYETVFGPIPKDLTIDHLCRCRECVNPAHLEAVTRVENVLRGNGWSGLNKRKTHCPRGHAYTADNIRWHSGNQRRCLACEKGMQRDYYHRNRERIKTRNESYRRARCAAGKCKHVTHKKNVA